MKSFESWAGGAWEWLGDGTPGNARRLPALGNEELITTGHAFATYEGMHLIPGNAHERHFPWRAGESGAEATPLMEFDRELWYADGETRKVSQVADLYPGPASSEPYGTIFTGNSIVFAATHPVYGRELWRAAARPYPPILVADLFTDNSVNPSSAPDELTPLDDVFVFVADDLAHGRELWSATPGERPVRVENIAEGPESSNPRGFVAWRDHVYFIADDGIHGEELWRSDGTAEGTEMVRDIVNSPVVPTGITQITPWNDRLLLSGATPESGHELWVMDEPELAPRLVRDVAPPSALAVFRGAVSDRAGTDSR